MPNEYISANSSGVSRLTGAYKAAVITLLPLICLYGFFYFSTYSLHKEIKKFREASGHTATPSLQAGEIQQERSKYQGRLEVINTVHGRAITTAGIAEILVKTAPAGTVLTGLEINFSAEAGQNPDGFGVVTIEGELPSVELVGLYLSDLQGLPVIKDALAKEIYCTRDRAIFTLNAGAGRSGG